MRLSKLFALSLLCTACGVGTSSSGLPTTGYLGYVRDREGSVLAAVDDQGKTLSQTQDDGFGLRLTSSGTPVPRAFLDKELDEETGYYHFQARYYDPSTAQWISPDPKLLANIDCSALVQGCEPYAFAGNRPLEWTDEDGRAVIPYTDRDGTPTMLVTAAVIGQTLGQAAEARDVLLQHVINIQSPVRVIVLTTIFKEGDAIPDGLTKIHIDPEHERADKALSSETLSNMVDVFIGLTAISHDYSEMARGAEIIHELLHAAGHPDEGYFKFLGLGFSKPGHINGYGGEYRDHPERVVVTDTEARDIMSPAAPGLMNGASDPASGVSTASDPSFLSNSTYKAAAGGGNLPIPAGL